MKRDRHGAERSGRLAETLAALWLAAKFYRIVARRSRGPLGEIDLIARKGRLLVAVEVKRRGTAATAVEAITPRQRRRIEAAAEAFRARQPDAATLSLRFDVVLVVPRRLPHHVVDAWRP